MSDAYVLGGVRTPIGKYGGALANVRVDDLLGDTMAAWRICFGVSTMTVCKRIATFGHTGQWTREEIRVNIANSYVCAARQRSE